MESQSLVSCAVVLRVRRSPRNRHVAGLEVQEYK